MFVVALLPLPATDVPSAVLIPIQMWNIETDRAAEVHNVLLPTRTWPQLESAVREAFKNNWTAENCGKFSLYYITDLSDPVEFREDVSSQAQLDAYLAWRPNSGRQSFLQLFLNVAVIFQASGKPVSPVKPPLTINTAMARAHDASRQVEPRSSSHLSPDSATSPQSPGTPRQREFRQMVLARDSEGCVRPDAALLQSPPPAIFRCVFCEKLLQPLKKQIEACHVVPHAVGERLGKSLDVEQQLAIGGSTEDIANGVSVCSICHGVFDSGLLWVEVDADGTQRIHVHESSRQVAHYAPLHEKRVHMPANPAFPFPGVAAWRWRREWATMQRDHDVAQTERKLAELELQGSPQIPCRCGRANVNKKCRTGTQNTPACKKCCEKSGQVCAPHRLAGVAAAAASSSSPP